MKTIKYLGPLPSVVAEIDGKEKTVKRGETVSLPDAIAERFVERRPKSWETARSKPSTSK